MELKEYIIYFNKTTKDLNKRIEKYSPFKSGFILTFCRAEFKNLIGAVKV